MTNSLGQAMYEVNIILNNTNEDIVKAIPEGVLKTIKEKAKEEKTFVYDRSKKLEDQNINDSTRGLLALIYRDYLCTEDEKAEYIKYYKNAIEEQEREKAEKYSVEKIFEKKNQVPEEQTKAMVAYKQETIWTKIKNLILSIFNK